MKQNTTYKQTELGLIPEDWEVKKLGELGFFFKGKGVPKTSIETEGKYKCLTYGDLYTKYDYVIKNVKSFINDASDSQEINFGDICIAGSGETIEDIGKCAVFIDDKTGYAGGDIIIFRSDENPLTLSYILNSDLCKRQKYRLGQGHSVVHIYSSQLQNLKIPLPPLPEQKKIADCLSTWDSAIEKQSALINALTDRKKALMQQLLTGKKRLPGFSEEWKEVSFEKLLKQIKRKEEWDDKKLYKLLSVKRRSEGIFDREHLFGYQIAVKELMKVKKDDFLISKMQIVHGASALVNDYFENYYVSGSYIVLNIRDKRILNPEFLNYYSKQKLFYYQTYLSSYGVHIEKMTFDFKTFLKIEMTIPSLEEQTAIAEILATADRELQLQKDKLAQLQSQKKGLMQVLLTGKKRLIN